LGGCGIAEECLELLAAAAAGSWVVRFRRLKTVVRFKLSPPTQEMGPYLGMVVMGELGETVSSCMEMGMSPAIVREVR
jgi:hypothetical protein